MRIDFLKYLNYSPEQPLFFSSGFFWLLFSIALLLYSVVYKKPVIRQAYLLLVSIYFYYLAGGWFFLMLIFSTLVDYYLGIGIHKAKRINSRKLLLIVSILINIGVLAYFKYAYFINDLVSGIRGTEHEVYNVFAGLLNRTAGTNYDIHSIILPVGVSFYTFQTISYTFDVYRRHVKPVKNIIDFGFYVSFFPQLVAGPIVRAADFIPQLYQKYSLSERQFWHAAFLIMGGLIKKMLIADHLAIGLIDKVFESPLSFTGFENIVSMYAYAIQIYFDFSGYTDIAIGVALILGFRLPINFNSPYQASSITDFWRRWHISLSSWLRDYLYIPLGGNRKGRVRTSINILLTMVIGGLWHGANMRFVFWGLYHGIVLVLERLFTRWIIPVNTKGRWGIILSRIMTFHLVLVGWLIFRAESLDIAWIMLKQGFTDFHAGNLIQFIAEESYIFILLIISFIIIAMPARLTESVRGWFISRSYWLKILIVIVVIIMIYEFQISELKPFIYFRF